MISWCRNRAVSQRWSRGRSGESHFSGKIPHMAPSNIPLVGPSSHSSQRLSSLRKITNGLLSKIDCLTWPCWLFSIHEKGRGTTGRVYFEKPTSALKTSRCGHQKDHHFPSLRLLGLLEDVILPPCRQATNSRSNTKTQDFSRQKVFWADYHRLNIFWID